MHSAVESVKAWADDHDATCRPADDAQPIAAEPEPRADATPTRTRCCARRSSRSSRTPPRPAGTSRPGSSRWSTTAELLAARAALAAAMGLDAATAAGR